MDIGAKVIDIIAEQAILDPGDVTLESTLDSLGIDSMGLVESIFAIEEAFDIQIPFNANDPSESDFNISSVSSIISSIEKLVAEKP
jgi:acyl carrier protein